MSESMPQAHEHTYTYTVTMHTGSGQTLAPAQWRGRHSEDALAALIHQGVVDTVTITTAQCHTNPEGCRVPLDLDLDADEDPMVYGSTEPPNWKRRLGVRCAVCKGEGLIPSCSACGQRAFVTYADGSVGRYRP